MSYQYNVVHASDIVESAEIEVKRFFKADAIFSYDNNADQNIYDENERKR